MPVWDDGRWEGLPVLDGDLTVDVCVVGLGGSGLAAVGELVARGRSVAGLDAGSVGGRAAGRNGGLLLAGTARPYHRAVEQLGPHRAAAVYRLTLDELDRMEGETPDLVRRTGSLRVAGDEAEEADCEAHLAALQADDLPAERYDGPEGRGILLPADGVANPLARCRALARRAASAGAALFERSPAVTIEGGAVTTPAGRVRASAVVVAVDGGLGSVLPELSGRVRTARCQMLATAPAPEVDLPRPVYLRWGYDYYQQLPDRRVALGGFRDRFEADEWTDCDDPTERVQAELERYLRSGLGVTAPVTHRWAGCIAFTDDHLPVLGEVRPGVVAAGAYSGTGNVLGPACGRAAAALAVGEHPPLVDLLAGAVRS